MKSGILLLDKRPGMTSFDCIRNLKKTLGRTDLGHGGTLDRFASGLLPILVGEGLKLARFFMESYPLLPTYWKTYSGTFALGQATETGDPEGAVTATGVVPELTREGVTEAMQGFVRREYHQVPPSFSAKKVSGERASDLARSGRAPDLKPVKVVVRRFECLAVEASMVRFEVECSKGTYVRRLAEDLATELRTVGHVRDLCRTAVGDYKVSEAVTLETVEKLGEQALLDLRTSTSFLSQFVLLPNEMDELGVGRTGNIAARLANSGLAPGVYCALSPREDRPAALFDLTAARGALFLRAFKA